MNFERGIDPKESLRIGRVHKAIRINSVEIYLGRHGVLIPGWPYAESFTGAYAHIILKALQKRKINWEIIMSRNPEFFKSIGPNDNLRFKVCFLTPFGERSVFVYPPLFQKGRIVSLRETMGKDILYDGILYSMPARK